MTIETYIGQSAGYEDLLALVVDCSVALDKSSQAIGEYARQTMAVNREMADGLMALEETSFRIKQFITNLRCLRVDASCDMRSRAAEGTCECLHCNAYQKVFLAYNKTR